MDIYRFKYLVLSAVLALAYFIMPTTTMAQTTMCDGRGTVGSGDGEIRQADMPFSILGPGIYCLMEDVSHTGSTSAIVIVADNVVLDLNDHVITGDSSTLYGILTGGTSNYATIKNGTIKGFGVGVYIYSEVTTGTLIEDLTIHGNGNLQYGIRLKYTDGAIVRNNRILDMDMDSGNPIYGIYISDSVNARIINNDIRGIKSGTSVAGGIFVDESDRSIVLQNRISDISSASTTAYGIFSYGFSNVIAEGNIVSNITGASSGYGINSLSYSADIINNRVTNVNGGSIEKGYQIYYGNYRDNIASAVTTPYYGGTDLGNND